MIISYLIPDDFIIKIKQLLWCPAHFQGHFHSSRRRLVGPDGESLHTLPAQEMRRFGSTQVMFYKQCSCILIIFWSGLPTSQTSQPHHLEPAYPSLPTSSRPRRIRWSLDHNYLIISDGSGEAVNEEEVHGRCFQPDIQETGVLTVNGWLWYKENIISKENLPCKYSLNWLQRHVGGHRWITWVEVVMLPLLKIDSTNRVKV